MVGKISLMIPAIHGGLCYCSINWMFKTILKKFGSEIMMRIAAGTRLSLTGLGCSSAPDTGRSFMAKISGPQNPGSTSLEVEQALPLLQELENSRGHVLRTEFRKEIPFGFLSKQKVYIQKQ